MEDVPNVMVVDGGVPVSRYQLPLPIPILPLRAATPLQQSVHSVAQQSNTLCSCCAKSKPKMHV